MKRGAFFFLLCLLVAFSGCSEDNTSAALQDSTAAQATSGQAEESGPQSEGQRGMSETEENIFYITVGETTFTADFEENSSADALRELLEEGPLILEMSDYGGFEKVAQLEQTLPRNDRQITTAPGDVVLYLGNSITIYYDTNSWNFTLLGKIRDADAQQLQQVLGEGDVTAVFSLTEPGA